MRQHKPRKRETNVINRSNSTIPLGEYSEVWNIYKLSGTKHEEDGYTDALTIGEYVTKIFGNLSNQVSIVNNYLIPAKEWVDPVTGGEGRIRLKNNGISNIADPDVDTFFPKWLWKGFLNFKSPQPLENERVVYFLTKGEPITDATGLITNTDVYILYAGQNRKLNGTFKFLDGTASFYDSNVAKNNNDDYITVKFYVFPSQPKNAKYIKFIPKSKVILSPKTIKIIHDGNIQNICEIDPDTNQNENLKNYNLDAFGWRINEGDASFRITSFMWPELSYQKKLWLQFRNTKFITDGGDKGAGNGSGISEFSVWNSNYIGTKENANLLYSNVWSAERLSIGSGELDPGFIAATEGWRINKGINGASQIPKRTAYSYDEDVIDALRDTANWKGNNSLFLADLYREVQSLPVVGKLASHDQYHIYDASIDIEIRNSQPELIKKFINGKLAINGYNMDIELEKKLIDNFPIDGNIENISNPLYLISNAIKKDFEYGGYIPWVMTEMKLDVSEFLNTHRCNMPDPWQTFANGYYYIREAFSNSYYSDVLYEKSNLILKIGNAANGYELEQFQIKLISGDFEIEYLDKDYNLAIAIDGDGIEHELGTLKLPSPQKIAPTNTQLVVIYV